jgi:hypothetical protein
MTKHIRKSLIRTGRILLAAGALGVPATALAQNTSPGGDRLAVSGAALPATFESPAAARADIKVELAFLANPTLFPCQLSVRALGSGIEIRGKVPTEVAHALALHVAQEESGLRVVDGIVVHPGSDRTPVTLPPEVLQRQAITALKNSFKRECVTVTVDVWTRGQVLLKGSVNTYHDKLLASRCLMQVSGCACVINQLSVVHPETPVKKVAAVAGNNQEPQSNNALQTVAMVQQSAGQSPLGQKTDAPQTTESKPRTGPFFQTKWHRWDDTPSSAPAAVVESSAPMPATQPVKPTTVPTANTTIIPASGQRPDPMPQAIKPAQPVPATTAPNFMPAETVKAALLPAVKQDGPAKPALPTAPVYTVAPLPAVPAPKPAARESDNVATVGFMIFEAEEQPAPAPRKIIVNPLQTKLQQRVAAVCGKSVKDVDVTIGAGKKVLVRITAATSREAESLSTKIFTMPELDPYQVSLDVQLPR